MAVIAGLLASLTEHDSLAPGLRWWNLAVGEALVGLAGAAVIYGQFFRRKTAYSRGVMCAVPVLMMLLLWVFPWRTAFGWQQRLAAQPAAGGDWMIVPAPKQRHMYPDLRMTQAEQQVGIGLPIQLRLPEGINALSDAVEISLIFPDGTTITVDSREARLAESRGCVG